MPEQTTPVISTQETEAEKLRLIKEIKKELSIHGLVDATAYIDEHAQINISHIHSGFVRSVVFKMEKEGVVEVIPLEEWQRFYIKKLSWEKRHPFLHAMRINFANSFLYLIAGVSVALIGSRLVEPKAERQLPTVTVTAHEILSQYYKAKYVPPSVKVGDRNRLILDTIVITLDQTNEPPDVIRYIVNDFKVKYGSKP